MLLFDLYIHHQIRLWRLMLMWELGDLHEMGRVNPHKNVCNGYFVAH